MHLLRENRKSARWRKVAIRDRGLALCRRRDGGLALGRGRQRPFALIVPVLEDGTPRALLLRAAGGDEIRVNGLPPLDASVLDDRDEITVAGAAERLYFVSGELSEPFVHAAGDDDLGCGRCMRPLAGRLVRRCACGTLLHHAPDDPAADCVGYDRARCPGCGRVLDAGWTPADADV